MPAPRQVELLLTSKWTSDELVGGWRHFEVRTLNRGPTGWMAELVASCDQNCRVEVSARDLLRRRGWKAGWALRSELSSNL